MGSFVRPRRAWGVEGGRSLISGEHSSARGHQRAHHVSAPHCRSSAPGRNVEQEEAGHGAEVIRRHPRVQRPNLLRRRKRPIRPAPRSSRRGGTPGATSKGLPNRSRRSVPVPAKAIRRTNWRTRLGAGEEGAPPPPPPLPKASDFSASREPSHAVRGRTPTGRRPGRQHWGPRASRPTYSEGASPQGRRPGRMNLGSHSRRRRRRWRERASSRSGPSRPQDEHRPKNKAPPPHESRRAI